MNIQWLMHNAITNNVVSWLMLSNRQSDNHSSSTTTNDYLSFHFSVSSEEKPSMEKQEINF
jgi:hypothetical protein